MLADEPPRERPTKQRKAPAPIPTQLIDTEGTGILIVGGDGALRAEIFVDNRSYGSAPRRLTLPRGSHRVVLRTPQGRELGPHIVNIESHHTPSAPARLIIPAAS